jgi:hypothetical protein
MERYAGDCSAYDEYTETYWGEIGRLQIVIADLLALAQAYEEWEADLVLHACWKGGLPRMTQAQLDRLIDIQTMRNTVVAKAKGEEK